MQIPAVPNTVIIALSTDSEQFPGFKVYHNTNLSFQLDDQKYSQVWLLRLNNVGGWVMAPGSCIRRG